ncbi:MAG: Eco57I restriction-modification methylase domain-containing protein [Pelolinea sp.]|nr:Eco57I restriction-modification methylase domain-containing protein [Pelolinea sp.]
MPAPENIQTLVRRFEEQYDSYISGAYNETQLRREFLDPFFEALGWDILNKNDWAEAYKEVIHEDAIRVGGTSKAPDYAFRIGGLRKFFVEAKKPAVNVREDIHPAYQLRRYAWSAKLPLSILTDFEEFAVYDCRQKPDKSDKASTGRIQIYSFKDYLEKWDEIREVFSRDAILKGSFDRFVESSKGKRGTAEVDDAFLQEIESWRDLLAHNIALRNQSLTNRELNYAVQMIIDRIIFLRICEDRGIEPIGSLQSLLNGGDTYARMLILFKNADERYNSGLFHFNDEKGQNDLPDTITSVLQIDDKILKEIIGGLYYPDSPYEFSVLPADILGQVYEQFLGKVIRLTPGHRAIVEEKPEVRKAGGVYYTPTFIVDYIVKNTIGELLKDKQPGDMGTGKGQPIRVLDPACGSGSFLIGAYQYLMDWYRDGYIAQGAEQHAKGKEPMLYQAAGEEWKLTTAERKQILLTHIFGVDIDPQAVEVTKLSLLLKVLEGESEQTLGRQMAFWQKRALPDLGGNIKCGNTLIGPDYYEDKQLSLLDEEERFRVNAFNWKTEFDLVFKGADGFDVVIGNPPYIRIQALKEWSPQEVEFYKQKYKAASKGNYDIYVVFVEKGLSLLNKHGKLGFILPHKFFQAQFAKPIRLILTKLRALVEIVHFGSNQIFKKATTYTCLLFLSKTPLEKFRFISIDTISSVNNLFNAIRNKLPNNNYREVLLKQPTESDTEWNFSANGQDIVLSKLCSNPLRLSDITRKIFVGLQTSADKIYVLKIIKWFDESVLCYSNALNKEVEIEKGLVKPFLMGKDVHRYEPVEAKNVVIFPYIVENGKAILMPQDYLRTKYPKGWDYLLLNKNELSKREKGKMRGEKFYAYIYPKNLTEFDAVKIMTPEIALGCQLTLDEKAINYHTTKVYSFIFKDSIKENYLYYLGILNSKILWFFIKTTGYTLRGGYFTFKTEYLRPFPIRTINFSNPEEKSQHDRIVLLAKRMLLLHKQHSRTPQEKENLKREIDTTDQQIDQLVYQLYGLSKEEIGIVEDKSDE